MINKKIAITEATERKNCFKCNTCGMEIITLETKVRCPDCIERDQWLGVKTFMEYEGKAVEFDQGYNGIVDGEEYFLLIDTKTKMTVLKEKGEKENIKNLHYLTPGLIETWERKTGQKIKI